MRINCAISRVNGGHYWDSNRDSNTKIGTKLMGSCQDDGCKVVSVQFPDLGAWQVHHAAPTFFAHTNIVGGRNELMLACSPRRRWDIGRTAAASPNPASCISGSEIFGSTENIARDGPMTDFNEWTCFI